MIGIVVGVMIALTMASERKIKDAYTAQFIQKKEEILEILEDSRADRSQEFLELCAKLAEHPYVISQLKGNDVAEDLRAFRTQFFSPQLTPGGRPSGEKGINERASAEMINLLTSLTTVDSDLTVERLQLQEAQNPLGKKGPRHRTPFKSRQFRDVAQRLLLEEKQRTLFVPLPAPNGTPDVKEMVATPVYDPDTRELLGLLLGGSAADIDARKVFRGEQVRSGIYLAGLFYTKSSDDGFIEKASASIEEALSNASSEKTLQFETDIEEDAIRFHIDRLTEAEVDPAAYQVVAFPLEKMQADLNELRIRGSGIGVGVVLIGWLASYLLARNLSIPLQELSRGTEAIRAGALDHRVEVRSRDEIGNLADSFNQMAEELKQKALYRELLGKVSDETVAQALVSGSLDLELGGEMKEVSVLFCDIRDFTDLTQDMHPSEVIEMMNDHMSAMTEVVRRHYGVVDKFVGDEIMAVFGALKSYGNDAANAAACALDMVAERERLNRDYQARNENAAWSSIAIGIGVATGEVIAGCMGSNDRLNYTVLGARVNLAARLCSTAGRMEAVIDDTTSLALGSEMETILIPDLKLKGFRDAVSAFRIQRVASNESLTPP